MGEPATVVVRKTQPSVKVYGDLDLGLAKNVRGTLTEVSETAQPEHVLAIRLKLRNH